MYVTERAGKRSHKMCRDTALSHLLENKVYKKVVTQRINLTAQVQQDFPCENFPSPKKQFPFRFARAVSPLAQLNRHLVRTIISAKPELQPRRFPLQKQTYFSFFCRIHFVKHSQKPTIGQRSIYVQYSQNSTQNKLLCTQLFCSPHSRFNLREQLLQIYNHPVESPRKMGV